MSFEGVIPDVLNEPRSGERSASRRVKGVHGHTHDYPSTGAVGPSPINLCLLHEGEVLLIHCLD